MFVPAEEVLDPNQRENRPLQSSSDRHPQKRPYPRTLGATIARLPEGCPEGDLLDLMNGLTLIGGILQAFDKCPKRIESFIDFLRASPQLGSGRRSNLTAAMLRVRA